LGLNLVHALSFYLALRLFLLHWLLWVGGVQSVLYI